MGDYPNPLLYKDNFRGEGCRSYRSMTICSTHKRLRFFFKTNLLQICNNLFNGSFPDEQKAVQEVVANVEMYSNLIKQVLKNQSWMQRTNLQHFTSYQLKTNCMNF